MKIKKKILFVLAPALFAVMAGIALYQGCSHLRARVIPSLLKSQLESKTGLSVNFSRMRFGLLSPFLITLEDVSASKGDSLSIETPRLRIELSPSSLIKGSVRVSALVLDSPVVKLGQAEAQPSRGKSWRMENISFEDASFYLSLGGRDVSAGGLTGKIAIGRDRALILEGKVEAKRGWVMRSGKKARLSGSFHLEGKRAVIKKLRIGRPDVFIDINGALAWEPSLVFTGEVRAGGMELGNGNGGFKMPENLSCQFRFRGDNLRYKRFPLSRVSAMVRLDAGEIELSDLQISSGPAWLKGSFSRSSSGVPAYDLSFLVPGGDLKEYLALLPGPARNITGTFSLKGRISGRAREANGEIDFSAKDGRIYRDQFFSKVLAFLNIYKLVKTGGEDLKARGLGFDKITCTFTLEKGMASTRNFFMDSHAFQASAFGYYSLVNDRLNGFTGLQLFESIDRAVSAANLLDMGRKDKAGELTMVWFKLNGPLANPSVAWIPFAGVAKSASDIIIKSLKLPGRILKSPMKILRQQGS